MARSALSVTSLGDPVLMRPCRGHGSSPGAENAYASLMDRSCQLVDHVVTPLDAIFLLMYSPSCQYKLTSSAFTAWYAHRRAVSINARTGGCGSRGNAAEPAAVSHHFSPNFRQLEVVPAVHIPARSPQRRFIS